MRIMITSKYNFTCTKIRTIGEYAMARIIQFITFCVLLNITPVIFAGTPVGGASLNASTEGNNTNKVFLCPVGSEELCPYGGRIIRQNVETGEVVELHPFCVKFSDMPSHFPKHCFGDECVAPGLYRYGYADPPTCGERHFYVRFFQEIKITNPQENCIRSEGNQAPRSYDGQVPWKDNPVKCDIWPKCGCTAENNNSFLTIELYVIIYLFIILYLRQRR